MRASIGVGLRVDQLDERGADVAAPEHADPHRRTPCVTSAAIRRRATVRLTASLRQACLDWLAR